MDLDLIFVDLAVVFIKAGFVLILLTCSLISLNSWGNIRYETCWLDFVPYNALMKRDGS